MLIAMLKWILKGFSAFSAFTRNWKGGPYLAFLMAISLKFQGCFLQAFPLFAQHFS